MIVRKINAGLSLLTTLMLMDHAIFYSVWMLSGGSIPKNAGSMPKILTALAVLHALLSIVLVLRSRGGTKENRGRAYPALNVQTCLQRISGIVMLLLLGIHIAGAAAQYQPKLLHAILHPLFFASALVHVSLSVGRAMITLGIGNALSVKIVDTVMRVLCAAVFAAAIAGFCVYVFAGAAG